MVTCILDHSLAFHQSWILWRSSTQNKQIFYSQLYESIVQVGKIWWRCGSPRALRGWPSKIHENFTYHTSAALVNSSHSHCCCCLITKLCPALLWPHILYPTGLLCSWNFPGKNTEVDCHFLLQEIFRPRDQTSMACIDRWTLYHEPLGKPCCNSTV